MEKKFFKKAEMYSANYEQAKEFGKNVQNRMINHGHVNQLRKSIAEGDLKLMPPITVNLITGNIIDGQHRRDAFIAAINSGEIDKNSLIEVKFVEIPVEKEIEAICNANVNSKNWSVDDFIESYAKVNLHYQKLQDFCNTHCLCYKVKLTENDTKKIIKLNYRYAVAMIKGKAGKKMLKDGSLTISEEEFKRADAIHNEVNKINEILFNGKMDPIIEGLAIAWYEFRDKSVFTFDEILKGIKKQKAKTIKQLNSGVKFDTILEAIGYTMLLEKNKK